MITFNDSSIIVGYIKELLYSFNLPQISAKDLKGSVPAYAFGDYIPNITTNLKLENNIYDTYTHEYLGNYLRFVRDYKGVNLMSLYNCFSNKSFTSGGFVYFIVPIKRDCDYTIKGPSTGFSYWFTDEKDANKIVSETVIPVKHTKNAFDNKAFVVANDTRKNYLIIKTPLDTSTNFVVLEGDYTKNKTYWANLQFNFDKTVDDVVNKTPTPESLAPFLSDISLISDYNEARKTSPFAEKLIEYLIGNVIIPGDMISNNIITAKEKARTKLKIDKTQKADYTDSYTVYDQMRFIDVVNKSRFKKHLTKDILGFVDTDVERALNDEGNE